MIADGGIILSRVVNDKQHIGKVIQIDGSPSAVARGDQFKPLPKSFSPVEHRFGVEVPYLLVEETILIAKGRDKAAG